MNHESTVVEIDFYGTLLDILGDFIPIPIIVALGGS
jgi:hypothetical protein